MRFHRKTKRRLKLEEQFKTSVTAYLAECGARLGRLYDHELDTPAGLLHISVYGGWVACRFDDVMLGCQFTDQHGPRCNSTNGKWNFHYSAGPEFEPDEAAANFQGYIERLLGRRAVSATRAASDPSVAMSLPHPATQSGDTL